MADKIGEPNGTLVLCLIITEDSLADLVQLIRLLVLYIGHVYLRIG